jgi:hypothetical protein
MYHEEFCSNSVFGSGCRPDVYVRVLQEGWEKVKNPVNGYLEKSPPNRKFYIHCTVMKESTAVVHCPNQTRGFYTHVPQSRKTLHSLHTLQTRERLKTIRVKGKGKLPRM